MNGICPNCEQETRLEVVRKDEEIIVRGEPVQIQVEFLKCTECGTEFRDPGSPDDPLDRAYREYRTRHAMLQPEEIREFRKRHGLTQHELARLLGWGAATLSRYENGALQDEAHDTTLKLAMEPENLLGLIEQKPDAVSREKRARLITALEGMIAGQALSFRGIYESRFGDYEPSELSGYRALNVSKLLNAIVFFCTGGAVPKTKLNKLLFYADFLHFKEYTISITGSRYAHLPYGPAPDQYQHYIAALHHEEQVIDIEERVFNVGSDEYAGEFITAREEPDLSLFSTSELKVLAMVKERFSGMTAREISDRSHEEEGYQQTANGDLISYRYALDLSV